MTRTALALAASVLSLAARAAPPAPPPAEPPPSPPAAPERSAASPSEPVPAAPAKPAVPRGAVLEEVSGTVRDIDRKAHRLSIDTASGPVTLSLDRNTMVYTATGLATVLDVAPGVQIRAGRNADFLAYWLQVRSPARQETQSTPGQGTGPAGGGSAPAGEAGGAAAGSTSPPTAVPGGVPPGSTSPGGAPAR